MSLPLRFENPSDNSVAMAVFHRQVVARRRPLGNLSSLVGADCLVGRRHQS